MSPNHKGFYVAKYFGDTELFLFREKKTGSSVWISGMSTNSVEDLFGSTAEIKPQGSLQRKHRGNSKFLCVPNNQQKVEIQQFPRSEVFSKKKSCSDSLEVKLFSTEKNLSNVFGMSELSAESGFSGQRFCGDSLGCKINLKEIIWDVFK